MNLEIRRNLQIAPCGLSITTQPESRPFHRRGRHLVFGSMQKIFTAMAFRGTYDSDYFNGTEADLRAYLLQK